MGALLIVILAAFATTILGVMVWSFIADYRDRGRRLEGDEAEQLLARRIHEMSTLPMLGAYKKDELRGRVVSLAVYARERKTAPPAGKSTPTPGTSLEGLERLLESSPYHEGSCLDGVRGRTA